MEENERKGYLSNRDHHYTFKGIRYENRLDCKNAIAREGNMRKVTDSFFDNLMAIKVVLKFN